MVDHDAAQHIKDGLDAIAVPTAVAGLLGLVPWFAALAALVYTSLRIVELMQHLRRTDQWPYGRFGVDFKEKQEDGDKPEGA